MAGPFQPSYLFWTLCRPRAPAAASSLCPQWENHNKSLQLEAQTYQRIHEKIQERVMNNLGTWIDWQYLQNAAKLLAKVCTPPSPEPCPVPGPGRPRPQGERPQKGLGR